MDAIDLARRIYDNLNWSLIVGSGSPFVEPNRLSDVWSQIEAIWGESDERFVAGLYLAVLARPADSTGLAANCAALAGGAQRAAIVRGLALSDEARRIGLDVSWLHRLDAMPTPPRGVRRLFSLDAWKARFRRKTQPDTWSRLVSLWSKPDEAFVDGLYHTLLRRSPDAEGLAGFCAGLAAGTSRTVVVRSMALSEEAQIHALDVAWLPLLDGMPPGRDRPRRLFSLGRIRTLFRRWHARQPAPAGTRRAG